jgi:Carboxypeptidase regulatory-like domain
MFPFSRCTCHYRSRAIPRASGSRSCFLGSLSLFNSTRTVLEDSVLKTFSFDLNPIKKAAKLLCCIFAMFVLTSLSVCYGQDVSGMTGEVTDTTGAALTGATVTLKNGATGVQYTATTNSQGVYRFSEIPPGDGYTATFTASGFTAVNVDSIYLTVANIRTQNATLKVGSQGQVVEVTASGSEVTIDTTSASIGNTFDVQKLNNLPVQQRNDPIALFTMQPGVTDTGSVTGARVDQNNVTVDGLDVNDFATGGAQQNNSGSGISTGFTIVGHAPVDSVEEFRGTVGGLGATAGPASGGQFQLVTKSGTNQFHGNINEYHRDPSLVANSWFSNNASPIVPRNHLIQNQFGGNIGGPVLRNKLFFFFDFNDSRIISSELVQRTVPLDNLRNGNIGYLNSAGGTSYLTPAQVQALDPAGIGISPTWQAGFTARYPHSNNTVTGDGVNSGGYSFNAPDNDFETNYVARMDYNLTPSMNLWGRFTIARENSVENPNEFEGDPATNPFIDRTYSFVIGHNWVIGANKTNRVFLGETVQKYNFPNSYNPSGSTFLTFSDGTGPALASSLYLNPNAQSRRVPIPIIGDDFSWTKGSHTWQFGGTFKDIKAHNTNVADYNTAEIGPGGFTLGLCGPVPGDCGTGNPSLRPADINTSGTEAEYDYDQAFLFSLGRIAEVSSDFNYNAQGNVLPQLTGDQRYYKYYQTQVYAADTWKVTRNLTLSYGVNYQNFSVPYETRGLETTINTNFNSYFGARINQSKAGQTGATAVPLISYILGGKANNGPPLYQPENHLFAPRLGFAFNPSWDQKTVFNGSIGIVYDRTIINAVQFIQDQDSYLFQQTLPTSLGISGDPYNSIKTGPRLDSKNGISNVSITPPATPKPPYQPFVQDGVPYGLSIGSAFNATIDPKLKTPYSIAFNAGMQHAFAGDMVMKLSYAGRLGRRLMAQTDANQVLDFPDPVSGQTLGQAFANVTQQLRNGATSATVVPQPWFENVIGANGPQDPGTSYTAFMVANVTGLVYRGDFGDVVQFLSDTGAPLNVGSAAQFSENTFYGNRGFSSYNAMLLTVSKNFSHGLNFDFNYTFGHSIDNTSNFANSQGDTGIGGVGLVCDAVRPRTCRANSDFDLNQIITADAVYQLPFGRGKAFVSSPSTWLNEVIGGWSLSGVSSWHTGQAWGTNSDAFVASYSNDAPGILVGQKSAVATKLQKPASGGVNIFANQTLAQSAYVGPIGFDIGSRNGLRGPKFFNADLGLGKAFPLYGDRVKANFRADAFNALNHPNFQTPASNAYNGLDQQDITSSQFGNISYTVVPSGNLNNGARVLQLSLRVDF